MELPEDAVSDLLDRLGRVEGQVRGGTPISSANLEILI